MAEHVSEKSRLQSEALKDKETVMSCQIELSQLKLQLKEMELSQSSPNPQKTDPTTAARDPEKDELYAALMKSNMEL